jgi:hypothetical protein
MLSTLVIPPGWKIAYGWLRQFTAAERHNAAMDEAKYYDRILFLDTDQIYPPDYFLKMLEHDEPVVSALNTTRYYPFDICAFRVKEEEERVNEDGGKVIIPLIEAMGNGHLANIDSECFSCDLTGTGALMIDPQILSKISKPYFKDIYDYSGKRIVVDDFYFGYKLLKAGYKPLIDTRIIPGHIAKIIVKPYNALDMKRAWEKVNNGYGIVKDGKKA